MSPVDKASILFWFMFHAEKSFAYLPRINADEFKYPGSFPALFGYDFRISIPLDGRIYAITPFDRPKFRYITTLN